MVSLVWAGEGWLWLAMCRVSTAALCDASSKVLRVREERRWPGSYRGRWRGEGRAWAAERIGTGRPSCTSNQSNWATAS